ncbi:uncharacterized protein [Dysidea avara]|uniref:uncharacterized protein n=1 Tax=Dysidea avara TaxID=196820 RepID=UPI003332A5A5
MALQPVLGKDTSVEESTASTWTYTEEEESSTTITSDGKVVMCHRERTFISTSSVEYLSGPPTPRSGILGYIGRKLGGGFTNEPEHMLECKEGESSCRLSANAQSLLRDIFKDVDPSDVVDYHVHLVGHGDSGSDCYLHPSTKSWWFPIRRLKTLVFMAAAQVPQMDGGDILYTSRLIRLVKHYIPANVLKPIGKGFLNPKCCLLPFDKFYSRDGKADINKTTLYVPNDYALTLAHDMPDCFYPFCSVNPYRSDALEELERCALAGCTVIKWLPNSMGIDPADEKCIRFYKKVCELDMTILVHVGDEHAVNAAFLDNTLGNPLKLRKPLDCGVKIIAAHCATEGTGKDLDNPGSKETSNFSLLLRLMREEKYENLLFADISAICSFRRIQYLPELLEARDIHSRLVYGSDYPVPAINIVVLTSRLLSYRLITAEQKEVLDELYSYNPLLFDLACKRCLVGPNGGFFPPNVFKAHPNLPPFKLPLPVKKSV